MKKRLLALLTILCLLSGCTVSLAENVGDSLVVGMVSTRTTEIRPLTPQEAGMVSLYNVVYESLVTVDDNGIPQPYLAEKWEESNSGETWTFTLRENLRFSDGSALTADDVVASAQYLLTLAKNEETEDNGFYQTLRYTISSISKADERTVIVKAARKYYGVLYSMTFPVVPAAQVEQANPLGSGPYVISAFEPGLAVNQPGQQITVAFLIGRDGNRRPQRNPQCRRGAGPHHTVHVQAVLALKPHHRVIGGLAEDAVGAAGHVPVLDQLLLHLPHVLALAAPGHLRVRVGERQHQGEGQ